MFEGGSTETDRERDARLISGARRGDESCLREAIDVHGSTVYGVARRILVDPHLAEEVTQDTFMVLWADRDRFDPERGNLRTFLGGVARNKAIDVVRRETVRARAREESQAEVDLSGERPGTESFVDDRLDLVTGLKQLTKLQRQALSLAYFGGRTYVEVAEELGIPVGTAKTRLRDGLTALRNVLMGQEATAT
jgi:RNA polymerase sigma-70 factor (ECF subfamily)